MKPVFRSVTLLNVLLDFGSSPIPVGRLAILDRRIVFEYTSGFPVDALNISPLKLRAATGLSIIPGPAAPFEGLHGVFNDSLPDGWGRLLVNRKAKELGIIPSQLTPLDRLAWVGTRGMGALIYQPERQLAAGRPAGHVDLDELAEASRKILEDVPEVVFEHLLMAGGSPQGARPKALVGLSAEYETAVYGTERLPAGFNHWLVKFIAPQECAEAGLIEKAYADMARAAGINMSESIVLPSSTSAGYFATRRFDRVNGRRLHMHTVSGMLHADFRLPSIGYAELLRLVGFVTRDQAAVEQMFLRMVFNVVAHNRDDHAKNHAFLMDESGQWSLSPAYDVTFTEGPGGEHTMDVAGEGRFPAMPHISKVAEGAGISPACVDAVVSKITDVVSSWPYYASSAGVSPEEIKRIGKFHLLFVKR